MNAASLVEHPLYASIARRGAQVAARLRQIPVHRWRLLVVAVVLLWVVHNLATAFWLLIPAPELEQPPLAPPPAAASSSPQAAGIDLAALQELALFGQGGVAAPIPEPEETLLPGIEQEAVDTSLNLQLQGVIASSNPDNAWAIVAEGNNQALYKVGDKLPQGNNVRLVKVLEQRVILDNNGRYESLWLYSEEDAKRRVNVSQDMPVEDSRYREEIEEEPYDYPDENQISADGEAAVEPEVRTLPASATEVKSISEVVRFTAARDDQGMAGYQVQPGRNRELFDQAGLQPGDIVTAVNGISLDDPQQIRAVYQELQSATQAELDILRDGEHVSVHISLDSAR